MRIKLLIPAFVLFALQASGPAFSQSAAGGGAVVAGAATAANQASEIAQLSAINARSQVFTPIASSAVLGAGGQAVSPERATGAVIGGALGPVTKYNVFVRTGDQPGTLNILARPVSNGSTYTVFSQTYAANTSAFVTVPVVFSVYLSQFIQGATANSAAGVTVADSLTSN